MDTLAVQAEKDWEGFKKRYISSPILSKEWDLVTDELFWGCYGLQVFNDDFCEQFIKAADDCGDWFQGIRYDTVPGPDLLLEHFGFNDFYNRILRELIYPIIIHKYHLESIMNKVTDDEKFHAKNFAIKYTPETQSHLSMHHDFSGITVLLTLNDAYEGGGTWFFDQQKLVKSKPGYMAIHPGMFTHYHGARPVTKGSRYVVLSFNNW